MKTKCIFLLVGSLFILFFSFAAGFNVGVRGTKCSLDKSDFNDPCPYLYNAICDGKRCKCPPFTTEDKTLKRCTKGSGSSSGKGSSDLDDLPFDYVPTGKNKDVSPSTNNRGSSATANTNSRQPIFPALPPNPNQPAGYPRQPSINPNQPGIPPRQPSGSDPHIGEKAGGSIGGIVGLLLIVGLVYFCCCRGEKGKNFMSKLPFRRGGARQQMQMQAVPDGPQQAYMPSDEQYPQPIPQGQPPPYTPTYQPAAPYPEK